MVANEEELIKKDGVIGFAIIMLHKKWPLNLCGPQDCSLSSTDLEVIRGSSVSTWELGSGLIHMSRIEGPGWISSAYLQKPKVSVMGIYVVSLFCCEALYSIVAMGMCVYNSFRRSKELETESCLQVGKVGPWEGERKISKKGIFSSRFREGQ